MKALTWHGRGDIRCDSVPDPKIQDGRDAIIEDPPEGDVQCPAHGLLGRECAYDKVARARGGFIAHAIGMSR
jgi:hypothetical protein